MYFILPEHLHGVSNGSSSEFSSSLKHTLQTGSSDSLESRGLTAFNWGFSSAIWGSTSIVGSFVRSFEFETPATETKF